MKNQIILGLAVVLSSIQLQSQNVAHGAMNPIVSTGTHFGTPVIDPKWSNTNGSGFTKASYREYSGETSVTITSPLAVEAQITVDADVAKGILKVAMQGKDEIVFQKVFTADGKHTINVPLKPDELYTIRFIGIRAKGTYFCQWKPIINQTLSIR